MLLIWEGKFDDDIYSRNRETLMTYVLYLVYPAPPLLFALIRDWTKEEEDKGARADAAGGNRLPREKTITRN